eukprot:6112964-Pyramimonas_sp.AAC.1
MRFYMGGAGAALAAPSHAANGVKRAAGISAGVLKRYKFQSFRHLVNKPVQQMGLRMLDEPETAKQKGLDFKDLVAFQLKVG